MGASPIPFSAVDLAAWEANYGSVAPLSVASAAVPEPATAIVVLLSGIVVMCFSRDEVL